MVHHHLISRVVLVFSGISDNDDLVQSVESRIQGILYTSALIPRHIALPSKVLCCAEHARPALPPELKSCLSFSLGML